MKILVIGCGKMGSVIAWDLCRYEEVESVGLVDNYAPSLENAAAWIQDNPDIWLTAAQVEYDVIALGDSGFRV